MPSLRLKTKLVIAITLMVVVIVTSLSALYLYEVINERIVELVKYSGSIASQVVAVARTSLQVDLRDAKIDLTDSKQVNAILVDLLESDSAVNSLLESWTSGQDSVLDIAITDPTGRVLSHSNPSMLGKTVAQREDLSNLLYAKIRDKLKIIYGPLRVYETRVVLQRLDGAQFGEVRLGVYTSFLRDQIRAPVKKAIAVSLAAILMSLIVSAGVSTIALRPLTQISRRLDALASGQAVPVDTESGRSDEYGVVSHKIERLGRQVRDVKEVFSAVKENLDQMMANLQDGVMLFTSDFRAVLVSASAERFIGKPRGDMLGGRPNEIFSNQTPLGRAILSAFQSRTPVVSEEIEGEHGRHVQISMDFIEEHGERIGALLTLRDAESVHRIEDEIELSRRLAAIGRLTSGVAHEVKNPINAIVLHLENLRHKLPELQPDTARHIDVISSEIHRLDRVVQVLVDFTRPVELHLREFDLRRILEDVTALAQPEAETRGVRIERNFPRDPVPVNVDVDLIKQAVLNVMINGVQAMPQGGRLRVSVSRKNGSAVAEIEDQGVGIPEDMREKIFTLYFTTKKAGSGIGLAMAYRVMQLHHGFVDFRSATERGATFELSLPLQAQRLEGPPKALL